MNRFKFYAFLQMPVTNAKISCVFNLKDSGQSIALYRPLVEQDGNRILDNKVGNMINVAKKN